jgi:hypothetical protein
VLDYEEVSAKSGTPTPEAEAEAVAVPNPLAVLRVRLFADGANNFYDSPLIQGFTTNPSLMRKAGISDYAGFAREVLSVISDRPISFEVVASSFRRWSARRAGLPVGVPTSM